MFDDRIKIRPLRSNKCRPLTNTPLLNGKSFATDSRQQRRARARKASNESLIRQYGYNMPRKARRLISLKKARAVA